MPEGLIPDRAALSVIGTAIATKIALTRPLCSLDLETAGVTPASDRIVEVAIVRISSGEHPGTFATSLHSVAPVNGS